jgi:very-short-patch-repair endonuclease
MPRATPRPPFRYRPANVLDHARGSRHAPTEAEKPIWPELRAHARGPRFRHPHPVGDHFIAHCDCAKARRCVAIDGDIPAGPHQKQDDVARTARLDSLGDCVIHLAHHEVRENSEAALETMRHARKRSTPHPEPSKGEGASIRLFGSPPHGQARREP